MKKKKDVKTPLHFPATTLSATMEYDDESDAWKGLQGKRKSVKK